MNLTDKGMQLKKGSRPSEKADGKVLKTQKSDVLIAGKLFTALAGAFSAATVDGHSVFEA